MEKACRTALVSNIEQGQEGPWGLKRGARIDHGAVLGWLDFGDVLIDGAIYYRKPHVDLAHRQHVGGKKTERGEIQRPPDLVESVGLSLSCPFLLHLHQHSYSALLQVGHMLWEKQIPYRVAVGPVFVSASEAPHVAKSHFPEKAWSLRRPWLLIEPFKGRP